LSLLLVDPYSRVLSFSAGHMARDCTQRRGGPGQQFGQQQPGAPQANPVAQQFDSEYASLMAELGETTTAPPLGGGPPGAPQQGGGDYGQQPPMNPVDENGNKIPPWRIASNW